MDMTDFKGVYKWKFLIPSLYIMSWVLMIIGPIFFPYGYQIYCIIIIAYSFFKTLGLGFGTLVSLIKLRLTIRQLQKQNNKKNAHSENRIISNYDSIYHAIVIPSYKEDQDVLLETLSVLAQSQRAKSQFIILLAMEAHQKGSDVKAQKLIEKAKKNFLYMAYTQHVVRENQAKGKASNVSWCVQHLEESIPNRLMVDVNNVLVTIIDADSWAPKQYFEKMEIQLKKRPQIKNRCMFSVPQIYTRNHLQVPVFNRTYDQMHSLVHLSNLVAVHYSFPLSNYTISYVLAKKIGWWDTCADAIGQDFHTCQKCYWKLQQENFITVPIYIPFNQVSLSTGEGYCNDIKARFWQAQRHTLGVSDVAYCWNMLFKTPFKFVNFILTLLVTQVFAMAAVIPWALLALGIQYKLVSNQSIHFFPMWSIDILLNITSVFTLISYIFYQWWKRIANKEIYGQKNDSWWRVVQYPILFMFALFGFSLPSFLIASFAVLCSTTQYRVAEKHIDKNHHINVQDKKEIDNKTIQQAAPITSKFDNKLNKKSDNIENQLHKKNSAPQSYKSQKNQILSGKTLSVSLQMDNNQRIQQNAENIDN